MIFTFRANKRQVEETAIKSREEGREEMRQEWEAWVDQIQGKPPEEWPPTPGSDNGSKNDHKEEK